MTGLRKQYAVAAALAALFVLWMSAVSHAAPFARECGVTMPCIGVQVGARHRPEARDANGNRAEDRGGRPAACHVSIRGRLIPWCGCWLGQYLGMADRDLWQARAWARVGRRASGPCVDCIAVWRHHVGIVKGIDGRRIRLLSGNDNGRVRERWRSTAGVIAWRTF